MIERLSARAVFESFDAGARQEAGHDGSGNTSVEAEASARLVGRYFEMWNTGEGTLADEVLGPRYVDHAYPDVIGPAASRSIAPRFHKAYPDARMTFEIVGADAEYVAVRNTIHKTHHGETVRVSGAALFRIGGGRIVEQWAWYPAALTGPFGWPKKNLDRAG
jgi:predicted SnoaL-like aldol condensation-catalyzing enzyme